MSKTIAIIGGGASGTLVVLNILKQSTTAVSVLWFDGTTNFGKGLAYATKDENHLLNVRASNMSAFVDEPTHFINWLQSQHLSYNKDSFVPRCIYGKYLDSTLQALLQNNTLVKLVLIDEEVIEIQKQTSYCVVTKNQTHYAEKVILALGNFLPAHPRSIEKEFISCDNYFRNAFSDKLITRALGKKHVTIIGSGLTMVDVVLSLYYNHYKGIITIISPHAYLPQAHSEMPLAPVKSYLKETKTYTLLGLVAIVKKQLKLAKQNNTNWHTVIDAMRPYLQKLWLDFSLQDKQQFLRHLRHKWGVARHRAPLKSMDVIYQLIESKHIELIKGRIHSVDTINDSFNIRYKNSNGQSMEFETDCIVNCTGPESDFATIESTLIQQLLKDKLIEVDDIKYGINATTDGKISEGLYTLGPPMKGLLWESTAIPEIRLQAKQLVQGFNG